MDSEHQKKETAVAAVLEVVNDCKENVETTTTATATTTENSSFRSSVSSFDSNYDHAAPLELGLLINALQTSLVEQNEEGEEATPAAVEGKMEEEENIELTTQSTVKREEKIIVGYEIDHGISHNTDSTLKKSTSLFTTANSAANLIVLNPVDAKNVKINTLTPREQEKADEPILKAIHHLFNNRFMEAKSIFEQEANNDPLYALGLGSMAFLKAVMTSNDQATSDAIKVLMSAYNLANAQIDNATKKNIGDTVIQYISSYCLYVKFTTSGTGIPTYVGPAKPRQLEMHKVDLVTNGVLRAHVAKAEASLQMAILYLQQENGIGYIKCGLNLKRAYASYSFVWQEYKRMGQLHNEYIDRDTISGIQFGIGSVHLVLSSLPQKILRIVAAFGWKADKHLGFALLKLCLENRRARSPMASLMLLAYYITLTALCPQILSDEYTQPAIETLLDAQSSYPNSAIFLYFAGRTSRLARNLTLSTQSFSYAIDASKNEWAEVEVLHMCSYELGFNHMMQNNWEKASIVFSQLYQEKYWSQAVFKYLTGACLDMMGHRTDAILAFAEVPHLIGKESNGSNSNTSGIENYVLRKVQLFQSSGYQDMDMTVCALEYLYLYNAYEFMDKVQLEQNLGLVDFALLKILEAERLEYGIRTRELLPETPPPQYDDQRGALLLIKSSILNAMGRFQESVIHLNWIIDRKDKIVADNWIIPYAYWEVGMTCWNLDQKSRGRAFCEIALGFTNYDFEYRLAMRANLAITKAEEMGIYTPDTKKKTAVKINIPFNSNSIINSSISNCLSDEPKSSKSVKKGSEKIVEEDCALKKTVSEDFSSAEPETLEHTVAQLDLGLN